jgi:hypothetical protein
MKENKYIILCLVPFPFLGSGSNFLTSYGSGYGSGSTSQKVTVPAVPVPVPQHCRGEAQSVHTDDLGLSSDLQLEEFLPPV